MTTAHPSNYTRGRTQRIEFLVLHYTAGRNDSAAGNLNYFRSPRGASAHYFIDRNGWLQSVDDGDTAWAVGTAGVYRQKHPRCHNGNSISIEMCCRYENGRYWLEDAVVENAALLTRTLMRTYQIPIGNVLRHYDVVSKRCPAMWVDDESAWVRFKRLVMEVMEVVSLMGQKDSFERELRHLYLRHLLQCAIMEGVSGRWRINRGGDAADRRVEEQLRKRLRFPPRRAGEGCVGFPRFFAISGDSGRKRGNKCQTPAATALAGVTVHVLSKGSGISP